MILFNVDWCFCCYWYCRFSIPKYSCFYSCWYKKLQKDFFPSFNFFILYEIMMSRIGTFIPSFFCPISWVLLFVSRYWLWHLLYLFLSLMFWGNWEPSVVSFVMSICFSLSSLNVFSDIFFFITSAQILLSLLSVDWSHCHFLIWV